MQVGTTQSRDQSQSLSASVSITKTHFEKQITTAERTLTMSGDFLEINIEINGYFAVRVLQDSLEKRLNEAFETAASICRLRVCWPAVKICRRKRFRGVLSILP